MSYNIAYIQKCPPYTGIAELAILRLAGDMLETQFGVIAGFTRMRVRWILRFGVFRADSPSSKPFVVVLES